MESGGRPSLGQFILLGTSSVVTAFLYSVYRQKAQVVRELKVSAGAGLASAWSSLPLAVVRPPVLRWAAPLSKTIQKGKQAWTLNGGARIRSHVSGRPVGSGG